MANSLYDKAREKFLRGELSWTDPNTSLKVLLVGKKSSTGQNSYQVNLATHATLQDINSDYRVAQSGALQNRQATNGVASADNIVLSNVPAGGVVQCLVIFKDGGTESSSPLIAYIDTASSNGLNPQNGILTDGGMIQIQWDSGPNKIFKL